MKCVSTIPSVGVGNSAVSVSFQGRAASELWVRAVATTASPSPTAIVSKPGEHVGNEIRTLSS
jgi:hypothetical protein